MNNPDNNRQNGRFRELLDKLVNHETISFVIFGAATSLLNVVLFYLLTEMGMEYKLANIITLTVTKLAAYICNKFWVFHSNTDSFLSFIKEFARYFIARLFTFAIDYFGLILLVEAAHLPKLISKCAVIGLVVIINYILGKKAVFNKN